MMSLKDAFFLFLVLLIFVLYYATCQEIVALKREARAIRKAVLTQEIENQENKVQTRSIILHLYKAVVEQQESTTNKGLKKNESITEL